MELQDSEIIFDPPFQSHKPGDISLRATIDGWLKDFFATVTCMQRLDTGSGDYLNEIREHFQMWLGSSCLANALRKAILWSVSTRSMPLLQAMPARFGLGAH